MEKNLHLLDIGDVFQLKNNKDKSLYMKIPKIAEYGCIHTVFNLTDNHTDWMDKLENVEELDYTMSIKEIMNIQRLILKMLQTLANPKEIEDY